MDKIEKLRNKLNLTTTKLKYIALITMLIDHFGASIIYLNFMKDVEYSNTIKIIYYTCRMIGRISFPLYAYLIAIGMIYTKNRFNYFKRLFIVGCISEVFFDYAFTKSFIYWGWQNVFFTLLLGGIAIHLFDKIKEENKLSVKTVLLSLGVLFTFVIATLLKTDYILAGVILILILYISIIMKNYWLMFMGLLAFGIACDEIVMIVDFIFIILSNNKKGHENKYFFYLSYPVHLMIYSIVNIILF